MQTIRPRDLGLALALTGTAGFLDAVGFLNLGGYFVSFMSGNTTRMSVDAVHTSWAEAGKALGIIGLFACGAVLGSVISRLGDGRVTVLACTSGVIGLSAIASIGSWFPVPAILIVALAMGLINATFLTNGEVSVGLTYMTGTLVKASQRLADAFFGGPRWLWLRYFGLWLALTLGAVFGAWSYTQIHLNVLWFVFAALCAITITARMFDTAAPADPAATVD